MYVHTYTHKPYTYIHTSNIYGYFNNLKEKKPKEIDIFFYILYLLFVGY